jgi:molybdenum cofactor biosynthesis enzyme MoaA
MTNKYCALPFNHVTVNPRGDYQICCKHSVPVEHRKNINFVSPEEWQKNQYLNEVRNSFEQGLEHPGCNRCWHHENLNVSSLRQEQAHEYQILGAKHFQQKLLNVELSVGNLCNLSCIMCNETSSSAILSENRRLNIARHDQREFTWSDTAFTHVEQMLATSPPVVNLRGGEPMYNKKILDLVNKFSSKDLSRTLLHITTNATYWSEEWQTALAKFRLVRIMLSIDAVDELYEYIRYPAQFSQVENNVKKIIANKNINPVIHVTVQNLNIASIGKLIAWSKKMNIYMMLELLTYPKNLQITNLPNHLKVQAIEHLEQILKTDLDAHLQNSLTAYKSILENALTLPFDSAQWQSFVDSVSMRDNLRGNSHRDFLKY